MQYIGSVADSDYGGRRSRQGSITPAALKTLLREVMHARGGREREGKGSVRHIREATKNSDSGAPLRVVGWLRQKLLRVKEDSVTSE